MAALSTTQEQIENRNTKLEKVVPFNSTPDAESLKFTLFDLIVLILSVLSIFTDLCTDLILIVEYYNSGYKSWALSTFILIFFPSIIVQTFSLRWHIVDKTASVIHWLLHICMLGILHRYILVMKAGMEARKSKRVSDFQKLYFDQSDLCILHLFESFLESAPQLVLQLYIIVVLNEWRFWTSLSAAASLLSLAWSLAAYTRAQRRARVDKNKTSWPGLILQAAWRTGMLTARISTLVLFAYCFGFWIFLFIGIHWFIMTVWIIYQKTDFCETDWEEKIYNSLAGVIYCFCFFNLQEGQSRWRALTFYLIMVFQNLTCLTVFLMWFAHNTPKLAITAFVAVVGGTIIGIASMLLYYRFFHPSGPIKFFLTANDSSPHDTSQSHSSGTLRSLKNMRHESASDTSQENSPQSDTKQLLNNCKSPLSDSVVIIEEKDMDDTDVDLKILQSWIEEENKKLKNPDTVDDKETDLEDESYKRRAICSSADLVKLIESKNDDIESNGSLKLVPTDESQSEILSAHDYENLCAVNIAREAWGLRSWRGYSDIETWLHDDSVVHDRRRDTLTSTTTSSEQSSSILQKTNERTRQDDYLDTIADDLAQCESETSSDGFTGQYSIDSLGGMYPISTLDTILEELEDSSTSTSLVEAKARCHGSASTLVATIDEIRLNTPVQNGDESSDRWDDFINPEIPCPRKSSLTPEEIIFLSKLKTIPEISETVATVLQEDNQNLNTNSVKSEEFEPVKKMSKNRPRRTFSLIREKFETKRSESTTDLFTSKERCNAVPYEQNKLKTDVVDKENMPTVASKINHWDKILNSQNVRKTPEKTKTITPLKKVNVKEKRNLFLKQVLTPPKFQTFRKRTLKMSP